MQVTLLQMKSFWLGFDKIYRACFSASSVLQKQVNVHQYYWSSSGRKGVLCAVQFHVVCGGVAVPARWCCCCQEPVYMPLPAAAAARNTWRQQRLEQ